MQGRQRWLLASFVALPLGMVACGGGAHANNSGQDAGPGDNAGAGGAAANGGTGGVEAGGGGASGGAGGSAAGGSGANGGAAGSAQGGPPSFTGWPLEFIETDLTTAYPNIEYYSRFAVVGGLYPYTFKLLKAPSGMQVQTRTGEIKWTPTQNDTSAAVEVQVTDRSGATQTRSYTIQVTKANFYFVDATNGNDSNPGTLASPFKTLLGVQTKGLPPTATLYVKHGTYVSTPIKMSEMPSIVMAYPGDKPVLDCQGQRTCIGMNANVHNPILFQGFEITHCAFKYFWVDNDKHGITWRNNVMHDLTVTQANDAYENPAFIFTSDYTNTPTPIYQHLILQNNQIYNLNNYNHDIHISPATFYDVSHSLEEDNVIHDIYDGTCIEDKDDGWYNTYRHNVCYNSDPNGIGLYNQYTQGQIEVENNLLIGSSGGTRLLRIGGQPGYIKNIYIHNNTFVDGQVGFAASIYGQAEHTYVFANNIFYNDSSLPFYEATGSFDPSKIGAPSSVGGPPITPSQAYVSAILTGNEALFENNLYWSPDSTQKMMTWSWGAYGIDLTGWKNLNFDVGSLFFVKPTLSTDGSYSLSPSDPYYGVYGKDFSPGVWQ